MNPDFIDDELATRYLNFCTTSDQWALLASNPIWNDRIIRHRAAPKSIRQSNLAVIDRIQHRIKEEYQISEELYPDSLAFVRWRVGDFQSPHADAENPDGSRHEFHWRNFASVLYLNEDYEGGEIFFPNQELELKPIPKSLIFFPGTLTFLHGVRPITSGARYTLTLFWTYDKNYRNL